MTFSVDARTFGTDCDQFGMFFQMRKLQGKSLGLTDVICIHACDQRRADLFDESLQ